MTNSPIVAIHTQWNGLTTSARQKKFSEEKIQSRYEILENHYTHCHEFNCPYCNAYIRCLAAINGPRLNSNAEEK